MGHKHEIERIKQEIQDINDNINKMMLNEAMKSKRLDDVLKERWRQLNQVECQRCGEKADTSIHYFFPHELERETFAWRKTIKCECGVYVVHKKWRKPDSDPKNSLDIN